MKAKKITMIFDSESFTNYERISFLREMEGNGLLYDKELCLARSKELDTKIEEISNKLKSIYPDVPINFASGDQLSAFLYGGTITEERKEFAGYTKTGKNVGKPRYKIVEIQHTLPRIYTPLPKTEMKKAGVYSTSQDTLLKLKGDKEHLNFLLELAKLEKLNGTYYKGLVSLAEEHHWPDGYLHGTFNQTVARTGRLSSSKPNLQNFSNELLDILISRYND